MSGCEENSPDKLSNDKKLEVPSWLTENITEASKSASKIYFIYIGFLVYCALTIISTSDIQIILNKTARLPVIDLDVSLHGFFQIAPLTALFILIYLQLYLHRIKGLITDIRTNFTIEKRRLYSWILNIAEDPEPGSIGRLQVGTVKFSLWYSLPLVSLLFTIWFIKTHEPILPYIIGITPLFIGLSVFWLWCKFVQINLQFKFNLAELLKHALIDYDKYFLLFIILVIEIILLFWIIPWANNGKELIGKLKYLKPWIHVDLSYQKVVTEPPAEYERHYWVDLKGIHLEGAELTATIFERADLRGAQFRVAQMAFAMLEGTNLGEANLEIAQMPYANLQKASLRGTKLLFAFLHSAKFQGACLYGTYFTKADLGWANLEGADLSLATLTNATLTYANLRKTTLGGTQFYNADLEGADLRDANARNAEFRKAKNLAIEQLSKVKSLYQARLDPPVLEQIRKEYPHLLEQPKLEEDSPRFNTACD